MMQGKVDTGQNVLDGLKSRPAGARAATEAGVLTADWEYPKYILIVISQKDKTESSLCTSSISLYFCRQSVIPY